MTLTFDFGSYLLKLEFCCLELIAAHGVCARLGHCIQWFLRQTPRWDRRTDGGTWYSV